MRRFAFAVVLLLAPHAARAQDHATATSQADIAKKLANPVSDMSSIPFQFNWDNGIGPDDGMRTTLNIQPVVPFRLSDDLNLIGRFILPHVSQPAALGASSGYGDVTMSMFFSPVSSSGTTWGAGPAFVLPMSEDPTLGAGQWCAGPTVVLLRQAGGLTYGFLANQVWSFGATSDVERPDVNQAFLQPFFAVVTKGGVTYTLQSESVANWEADDDDTWTVPVNAIVSKLTKIGPFPFSVAGGGGVYVQKPEGGPDWKLRTAFTVILPGGSK